MYQPATQLLITEHLTGDATQDQEVDKNDTIAPQSDGMSLLAVYYLHGDHSAAATAHRLVHSAATYILNQELCDIFCRSVI